MWVARMGGASGACTESIKFIGCKIYKEERIKWKRFRPGKIIASLHALCSLVCRRLLSQLECPGTLPGILLGRPVVAFGLCLCIIRTCCCCCCRNSGSAAFCGKYIFILCNFAHVFPQYLLCFSEGLFSSGWHTAWHTVLWHKHNSAL